MNKFNKNNNWFLGMASFLICYLIGGILAFGFSKYPITHIVGDIFIIISLVIVIINIIHTLIGKDEVWFAKLRDNAIIPTKRKEDACYDLYACITKDIIIQPGQTVPIPTGICSAFGDGYAVIFRERGSNIKWGGILQAGVVDSGYRGEYFAAIYNGNDKAIRITPLTDCYTDITKTETEIIVPISKAICQFSIQRVPIVNTVEKSLEEVLNVASQRGTGKLGSSGK